MTARILFSCGIYPGREEDLIPPNSGNQDGHWENGAAVAVNETLLNELGGGWDNPPLLPDDWQEQNFAIRVIPRAKAFIEELSAHPPWGWKDPRSSLLMPFWLALLPNCRVCICLRNPVEVALSLRQRGLMSYALGLTLWKTYNERLMASVGKGQRIVSHYQQMISNPEDELRRLLDFLQISPSEETLVAATRHIKSELRHHRSGMQKLRDAHVAPDIIDLYSRMCEEAQWHEPEGESIRVSSVGSSAKQVDIGAVEHDLLWPEVEKLRMLVAARDRQIAELEAKTANIDSAQDGDARGRNVAMLFFSDNEGFSEEMSIKASCPFGVWSRVTFEMDPGVRHKSLRLDPSAIPGVIDVAGIAIRASDTGKVLWRARARDDLQKLVIGGTALPLRHDRVFRILNVGEDPQILLGRFDGEEFEQPLAIEAWLKIDTSLDVIRGLMEGPPTAPPREPVAEERGGRNVVGLSLSEDGSEGKAEESLTEVPFGSWKIVRFCATRGVMGRKIRITPTRIPGIVDVAAVTIRSSTTGGILWRARTMCRLREIAISGSTYEMPHERLLRLASLTGDSSLSVPMMDAPEFNRPVTIEVWLRVTNSSSEIQKMGSEANTRLRHAELRARRAEASLQQERGRAAAETSELWKLASEFEATLLRERESRRAARDTAELHIHTVAGPKVLKAQCREGRWHRLRFELPSHTESKAISLRLPAMPGIIDIAGVVLREGGASCAVRALRRKELDCARAAGDAVDIPSSRASRFLMAGDDARVEFSLPERAFERTRWLEIPIKRVEGAASIHKAFQEWAAQISVEASNAASREREDAEKTNRVLLDGAAARLEEALKDVRESKAENDQLRAELTRVADLFEDTVTHTHRLGTELGDTKRLLQVSGEEKQAQAAQLAQMEAEIMQARAEIKRATSEIAALKSMAAVRSGEVAQLRTRQRETRKKLDARKAELDRIKNSVTWKAATPWRKIESHFTKRVNGSGPGEETRKFRYAIESALEILEAGREILVQGWCCAGGGIKVEGVRAVAGNETFEGKCGIFRPDVAKVLNGAPGAEFSGFHISLKLPEGRTHLNLEARGEGGRWERFHSAEVVAYA